MMSGISIRNMGPSCKLLKLMYSLSPFEVHPVLMGVIHNKRFHMRSPSWWWNAAFRLLRNGVDVYIIPSHSRGC